MSSSNEPDVSPAAVDGGTGIALLCRFVARAARHASEASAPGQCSATGEFEPRRGDGASVRKAKIAFFLLSLSQSSRRAEETRLAAAARGAVRLQEVHALIADCEELQASPESEMREMANEEKQALLQELWDVETAIFDALVDPDEEEDANEAVIEVNEAPKIPNLLFLLTYAFQIRAGTGGSEAQVNDSFAFSFTLGADSFSESSFRWKFWKCIESFAWLTTGSLRLA